MDKIQLPEFDSPQSTQVFAQGCGFDPQDPSIQTMLGNWKKANTQLKSTTSLHLTFSVDEKTGNSKVYDALQMALVNLQYQYFTSLGYQSLFTIY